MYCADRYAVCLGVCWAYILCTSALEARVQLGSSEVNTVTMSGRIDSNRYSLSRPVNVSVAPRVPTGLAESDQMIVS